MRPPTGIDLIPGTRTQQLVSRIVAETIRTVPIRLLAGIVFVVTAEVQASCGTGQTVPTPFAQVRDTGEVLNLEQLYATGFKKSKTYNVDTLPKATDAIFGFWKTGNGDTLDFEIRFYESAADARQFGTDPAREGTGDDAVLNDEDASFKDGVKDRRTIIGAGEGGGGRSGIGPKYADYVIYNNVIILCPGGQAEQSHERCTELVNALEAS
jgi:hypothetical protein